MPENIHNDYPKEWETWKNKDAYEVPKGYFDQLEEKLIDKIPEAQPRQIRKWTAWVPAIAAILLLAIGINWYLGTEQGSTDTALSENEYEYFIDENIDEFEDASLYSLLDDDQIEYIEFEVLDGIETESDIVPTDDELLELL